MVSVIIFSVIVAIPRQEKCRTWYLGGYLTVLTVLYCWFPRTKTSPTSPSASSGGLQLVWPLRALVPSALLVTLHSKKPHSVSLKLNLYFKVVDNLTKRIQKRDMWDSVDSFKVNDHSGAFVCELTNYSWHLLGGIWAAKISRKVGETEGAPRRRPRARR